MTDVSASTIAELLRPFLDAWLRRNEMKVVKEAGSLIFWRDGMLKELELIAECKATDATFEELKRKFVESEAPVAKTMEKLRSIRNKLAGSKIAGQIDIILNDRCGKASIRGSLKGLAFRLVKPENLPSPEKLPEIEAQVAQMLCTYIRALNAEIERLSRMISETN